MPCPGLGKRHSVVLGKAAGRGSLADRSGNMVLTGRERSVPGNDGERAGLLDVAARYLP